MKFFDTHSHYCDDRFDEDRDALLEKLLAESNCGILTCPSDLDDVAFSKELAHRYENVWYAAGIHPHDCEKYEISDLDKLFPYLEDEKCVAVGECGLDYYYDFAYRDTQIAFFRAQCDIAKQVKKPIIVHDREAHADTINVLSDLRPEAIIHCYSGSLESAKILVGLGCYISFAGTLTFKNASKLLSVAQWVPEDRILIETDAPYLAPEPMRGRRNDSSLVMHTAQRLADLRGCSLEHIAEVTANNAKKVFGI